MSKFSLLHPCSKARFLALSEGYRANWQALNWRADLLAGLLGALLVLPQGVAFAKLAGMPAIYGIYSAIVPCVIAALFGSSRHVVTGPTNANSLALFAMLSPLAVVGSTEYVQLALTLTLLVGVFQLLVACLRLGALANFIAPSVLLGFTTGAACLIAYHAGLDLWQYMQQPDRTSGVVEGLIALVALVIIVVLNRYRPRWPHMLLGLCGAYGVAHLASAYWGLHIHVLGALPSVIPRFSIPQLEWQQLPNLLAMAFSLSIVALGQSISIAKAVAEKSGQKINANREFFGQGLSNLLGSFFSSYLSCGSLNRSMPNYESGAKSPFAAVFSAGFVLLLAAVGSQQISALPMAAIAALLLYVAWTLISFKKIKDCLRFNVQEATVFSSTFIATLCLPIEMAIVLGVIVSLLFYLYKSARPALVEFIPAPFTAHFIRKGHSHAACPQMKIAHLEGDLFFGSVNRVQQQFEQWRSESPECQNLLLLVAGVHQLDHAGVQLLKYENKQRLALGGGLYLHNLEPSLQAVLVSSQALPEQHMFVRKQVAIHDISKHFDRERCKACPLSVFTECATLKQDENAES